MHLHKLLIYIMALSLLICSVPFGIDKETDKKQERKKADTLTKRPDTPGQQGNKNQPGGSGSTGGRDYNDFIDKNNNGIDDRAEYKKKVSSQNVDSSQTKTKKADSSKAQKK